MRILVTGANGITGHAVIHHLVESGAEILGLVFRKASEDSIIGLGATPIIGDLRDVNALRQAMASVERVYHICPAWVPDEVEIGEAVIAAAQASDIELFGYHSVIAPHIEEIPSHWDKMRVQMALMQSRLAFSIFQSAAYMQNIAPALASLKSEDTLALPWRTDAALSWVDVEDVGAAVAELMTRPQQIGGTYELCGTDAPLSATDIASLVSRRFGRPIAARTCSVDDFVRKQPVMNCSAEQLHRLSAYFSFLDTYGMMAGGPNVLKMFLGRPPTLFDDVIERFS